MLIAVMTYFVLFCYWPMYGNIVAFKNYKPFLGLAKSKWVGFDNFTEFFGSVYFGRILRNTLVLAVSAEDADKTMELLKSNGEAGYVLGNIVKKTGEDVELQ